MTLFGLLYSIFLIIDLKKFLNQRRNLNARPDPGSEAGRSWFLKLRNWDCTDGGRLWF